MPRGGPDGGDGGKGGDVVLEATPQLTTLLDVSRRSLYAAENGRPGRGSNCNGRKGKDLVVEVPVGTVVRLVVADRDSQKGPLLADLSTEGQRVVVAQGGHGGRGNKAFATSTSQTPREAEDGGPAVERKLYLELKLLADVGLVGLPNAGKSTFLASISAARPKVADYPFTTTHPHLGIADIGDWRRLVFADIPGLIEGAHAGHGLGIEFLRHVERTRVLVHLVSAEERDPEKLRSHYRIIEDELAGFDQALIEKPRLVVLSKCDLMPPEEASELAESLAEAIDRPVASISSVTGAGVQELLRRVDDTLARLDAAAEDR